MLTGSADVEALAHGVATIASFTTEPVRFEGVEVVQAVFELPYSSRETTLPPGLHPTTPPLLVIVGWSVPDGAWGHFSMVQSRVSCRSGVRPRGFVKGCVVDNPHAAGELARRWGLPAVAGSVRLRRSYDGASLSVCRDGRDTLRVACLDPVPLDPGDVQFTVTTVLAKTPRGLRLVQVEPAYHVRRVERLRPRLEVFDGSSWGDPLLEPRHAVSATVSICDIELGALRFLSRPDVLAFEGTEKL